MIFKLYDSDLGYSARVIHSFLCRELVTYKMHELWFVFARRPLWFSLLEFHAVTGLQCDTSLSLEELVDWEYDGGFWSIVLRKKQGICMLDLWKKHKEAVKKWSNADRIRLVYLCIIVCMVCARDEKANIPLKYIKLVMDLEKVRNYPWGVAAFDLLCESIAKTRDKLKEKTSSYVLDGFSYALQIWEMEAVPKIGKLCGKRLNKGFKNGPRCINWMGADDIYPYISVTANCDVIDEADFCREDEVEDDRIKVLKRIIMTKHDFSDHTWGFEETPDFYFEVDDIEGSFSEATQTGKVPENDEEAASDEEFRTPRGSANIASTARKGKKRLPDHGMEKRKHKVLSTRPQQAPFNEDMKAFVAQLFQHNFSAMEERLQKQIGERFEKMQSDLKGSVKDAGVEVEHGEPSCSKPSPSKPSPRKPSQSQPSPSKPSPSKPSPSKPSPSKPSPSKPSPSKPLPRKSKRLDVNLSQEEDIDGVIGTQGLEGLSQASYVPGFDPSQINTDDEPRDWWTPMTTVRKLPKIEPMQETSAPPSANWERWCKGKCKKLELSDSPMAQDGSPVSSLYYFFEESWNRFTKWSMNPITLQIGPICFNSAVASRIVCTGKWLGNEEMDAFMYIWRANTTLKRWTPNRVAFMNAMFCLQMDTAYNMFAVNKKGYELPDFLLGYGRGELPSHGRTDKVWGADVDCLYFPLFVNGNHWSAVCVNIIEKKVEVFDCGRGKNRQYLEKLAALIPRIVKAVGPPENKKQLLLAPYSVIEVPMKARLNKSCCDCGAYALKHLECHVLGLDLSLVDDEIIQGCRQKIAVELWETAHDPILAQVMTQYVPSPWERSEVFDLEED
ncbi:hypothetical protein N665_0041s0013 [Sinapis alba]|nr:hypothetical protein N665_0041s0013 [Sinapis alba]